MYVHNGSVVCFPVCHNIILQWYNSCLYTEVSRYNYVCGHKPGFVIADVPSPLQHIYDIPTVKHLLAIRFLVLVYTSLSAARVTIGSHGKSPLLGPSTWLIAVS